jgi:Homeodomain-like domain-containing protein
VSAVPKILRARPPHDDGEDRKVRKLAGARHAPADRSERARIVALSWDGLGMPAIAEQLGCHPKKVRRWLHRFSAAGIDGLGDAPSPNHVPTAGALCTSFKERSINTATALA